MRRGSLLVALALALPAPVRAQAAAPSRASCLDSIPASALHPTVAYLVSHYADSAAGDRRAMVPVLDNLTQAVAVRVRAMLDTSTTHLPAGEPALGWRDVGGRVDVVWRSDGVMTWRVHPDSVGPYQGATSAVGLIARALAALRADGEQLIVPDSTRHDSVTFSLAYTTPDFREDGSVEPLTLRVGVPVFSIRVPWSAPVSTRRGQRSPRYPARARELGVGGVVLARFLVGDDGRYVAGSYVPLYPPYMAKPQGDEVSMWLEFVDAVRDGLPRIEFTPARIGGCAVPQLVQQPFTFRLSGTVQRAPGAESPEPAIPRIRFP